jgi:hypothetical protein
MKTPAFAVKHRNLALTWFAAQALHTIMTQIRPSARALSAMMMTKLNAVSKKVLVAQ